jgi:hypothetical protein
MKIFRFLVLLLLIAPAAEARNEPMAFIQRIGEKFYNLNKQYQQTDSTDPAFQAASRKIIEDTTDGLRFRLLTDPTWRPGLTIPNQEGTTLLQIAVFVGVAEWVELLLAQPEVWTDLDRQTDEFGSAWSIASVAPLLSWRVCGDDEGMSHGAEIMRGYHASLPGGIPYSAIRHLLEDAGATPRPDLAREVWLSHCQPGQEKIPGVRMRVANAPDILDALLYEIETLPETNPDYE